MDKPSFTDKEWKDFYLSDFFVFEKGNQNNMASLANGTLPLVSAKKTDNGYKGFVSRQQRKIFRGGTLTLNNDGDGGAGIAYYQPSSMALDSHVSALIPKEDLNKYHLLFISMCITKQRNRFGHGYSINSARLRAFKIMLPLAKDLKKPDWQFMEEFMRKKEIELLKPAVEQLCKRLINKEISGGVNYLALNGNHFVLQMSLQKFNVANVSKRPTTQTVLFHTCHPQHSTMAWMASLAMKAA